jgi:hypothetical protein
MDFMSSLRGVASTNGGLEGHHPEISLQRETYIRSNNNKKKIKQTDFPAE